MDTFGERLRAERERLGLSQVAFGELGGVQKVAQINYEKDKRKPDAEYLAAIAAAGVDVLYVLTGQLLNHPKSQHLTNRESLDQEVTGKSKLRSTATLIEVDNKDTNELAPTEAEINEVLMRRIVVMLTKMAKAAGKRWQSEQLMLAAVDVYKFLAKEENVDDNKLERTLKLVVNR